MIYGLGKSGVSTFKFLRKKANIYLFDDDLKINQKFISLNKIPKKNFKQIDLLRKRRNSNYLIEPYFIDNRNIFYLPFGIDNKYWKPNLQDTKIKNYVFAIGNDYARDWITLINSWDIDFPKLKIIKDKTFVGNKSNLTGNYISLGKELSFTLNLKLGDDVSIMSSSGVDTIIGSIPKKKSFTIVSLFESGLADFDNNVAFINIDTLDEFMNLSKNDRKLEVYLKDPQNIENQKEIVQKIFPNDFVYSWADTNSSLFSALKVERNVMFIILSLIIIVAAFNIISGLTILVKNKTRDIAILKSIGVLNKSIIKIFFLVGVTIGTSATLFGIILGVTFSMYVENVRKFLSDVFNISLFPEEIYFLSTMPSEINPSSIFIISLCSIFITIIVSIFPAMKAAKLDPIKALKYE